MIDTPTGNFGAYPSDILPRTELGRNFGAFHASEREQLGGVLFLPLYKIVRDRTSSDGRPRRPPPPSGRLANRTSSFHNQPVEHTSSLRRNGCVTGELPVWTECGFVTALRSEWSQSRVGPFSSPEQCHFLHGRGGKGGHGPAANSLVWAVAAGREPLQSEE